MLQLHEDLNFHYETMRAIGTVPYGGADINEIFEIMPRIKAGDFHSWYEEWFALAQRVLSTIDERQESSYAPATLRNVYFRASHYIFVADFFLHGNKNDPRMEECFKLWRHYFDKANGYLPIPGRHASVKTTKGFDVPVIVFQSAQATASTPRPTLIVGGGFESNMEETFHVFGVAALERGYNVVIYEGPGHRSLIRQGHGFIPDWEQVVTPIVDFLLELSFVDKAKIGLVGMSLGGYLAARAAAFEPRLAAVMCVDGVYSFVDTCLDGFFPQGRQLLANGDAAEFDRLFEKDPLTWSTGRRWFHDDLLYTFCKDSAFEAYKVTEQMTLANGVAQRIQMPAFIGDAEDDMFFAGQPASVAAAIGPHATLKEFGKEQGAQLHCQSGALVYLNQEMLEWFARVVR